MKEGYIIKSASNSVSDKQELSLINNYTRRDYKEDEIYVFSVVLCDNEIDRDFECFTIEALKKLANLFVGKTGIFDHSMESKNQTARIFSCNVEKVDGALNSQGEEYYRLVARAYLPIIEKNKDLIEEIDSGIKKEVSVSCGVKKRICSICGKDVVRNKCSHSKGTIYGDEGNKKLCYVILDEPTDAYEWSFVAVPAQKEAGVIKSYEFNESLNSGEFINIDSIVDKLNNGTDVVLNSMQAKKMYDFMKELKSLSVDGLAYKEELRNEVIKLSLRVFPQLKSSTINELSKTMTIEQLKAFKLAYLSKINESNMTTPQLFVDEGSQSNNTQFKM